MLCAPDVSEREDQYVQDVDLLILRYSTMNE